MSKTGETFYSPISAAGISQLRAREKLVSAEYKTVNEVAYLNSNTAFIKVTSGVDAVTRPPRSEDPDYRKKSAPYTKAQDLETYKDEGPLDRVYFDAETSSALAQKVILFNGTSKADGSGVKMRSGLDFEGTPLPASDSAYNKYNSIGIRPMPGVTSFNIQSYNPYGTLRIANVKFTVHSLEDLDLVERLFLRPGYSCIVEWGHTDYINNSGDHKKPIMGSTTLSNSMLFNKKEVVKVEEDIERKRSNSSFNYDAFFGFVTNFDYVFRPDGGFDCSMKIASKGQVLDSIKSGKVSDSVKISKQDDKKNDGKINYLKSIYHFWLAVVEEYSEVALKGGPSTFVQKDLDTLLSEFNNKTKVECVPYDDVTELNKSFHALYTSVEEYSWFWNTDIDTVYVPLRFLLGIFNFGGSLYSQVDGIDQKIVAFETENSNKFNWFEGMFSTKIHKVVIPTTKSHDGVHYGFEKFTKTVTFGSDTEFPFNTKLTEYCNGDGDILDIHISTGLIQSKLDPFVKDAGDTINFVDFIKSILSEINGAFAGIINLDIYFNETANKFEIVDRNGPKPNSIPRLNLTGLKSTVKNLGIASSVTNNIAAQIAIAAQGKDTSYPVNVRAIRGWNEGFVDRFFLEKRTAKEAFKQSKDKLQSVRNYLDDNTDIVKQTKAYYEYLFDEGTIEPDTQDTVEKELSTFLLVVYQNYLYTTSKPSPIPIPVNLDFTMKGFSGMKIGQSFKVQDSLLLPKYKKYGFIIVGLEHTVENNEWLTNVRAQFFDVE